MIAAEAFVALVGLLLAAIVVLLAIIARDCSLIADMLHDQRERERLAFRTVRRD
ncbi:hypothetical protein [Rhizorhabdus sp.]|uniref:hypothetical protein n=1 Tax=Rhizorhabdus sp. TaxID=1968843 RepID=UPI0035B3A725